MCGRYAYFGPLDILKESVHIDVIDAEPKPNYNVAPTQNIPVVLRQANKNHLRHMRWGLVPFWAKDSSMGSRMINARAETVHEKPSFRNAFKKRRCLIPANGFYEWKDKRPYLITLASQRLFFFAGIWETWKAELHTFTIITTAASSGLSHLHHRMPVILAPELFTPWLENTVDLDSIPVPEFTCHPVSKKVNSVKNNGPELLVAQDGPIH